MGGLVPCWTATACPILYIAELPRHKFPSLSTFLCYLQPCQTWMLLRVPHNRRETYAGFAAGPDHVHLAGLPTADASQEAPDQTPRLLLRMLSLPPLLPVGLAHIGWAVRY